MRHDVWVEDFNTGGVGGFNWSMDEPMMREAFAKDVKDGVLAVRLIRVTVDTEAFDEDPFASGFGDGGCDTGHPMEDIAYEVSDNLRWDEKHYSGEGVEAEVVESFVNPDFLEDCGYDA